MVESFVRRRIDLAFYLGLGPTGEDGQKVVSVSGLRASVNIVKAGSTSMGKLMLRVYGLSLSLMNELSAVTAPDMHVRKNSIIVAAGDDQSGMATVFQGGITMGWADLNCAPEATLNIVALTGIFPAVKPVPPTSYKGSADAAIILAGLAEEMQVGFENNGVSVMLANPYFPGTARDQALSVIKAAGIEWNGMDGNVLAIWPKGGSRGGLIPLISFDTGMVGYPAYTGRGISLTTLFNPSIIFNGMVDVKSSLIPASGRWAVKYMAHELESETPNGAWFTRIMGVRNDRSPGQ